MHTVDYLSPNATNEMLVPIILYMDGISLDAHGRLSLCPFNITLGIFTVEAKIARGRGDNIFSPRH